ncbi:hypothetical protein [Gemmatimonas aurantiaca]|uniref:hypothetical protein n=1 Tax=Gemmatimonas aurantiaca TaxID=173480 RepID=UPI00301BA293
MPFFSHPANADWLLPIIKLPLMLISGIFSVILTIGPFGQIALIAIIIALFARNIMGPVRS